MARYMVLPDRNRDFWSDYYEVFTDLKIGETKSVMLKEEIGNAKKALLRDRWSEIAGYRLDDDQIKMLTVQMMRRSPRTTITKKGLLKITKDVIGGENMTKDT